MATAGRAFTRRAGALTAVAVAPGGTTVYTGGDDGSVRHWDLASGAQLHVGLMRHDGPVTGLIATPDGEKLVSAGADASVQVWDPAAGQPIFALTGYSGPVLALALAPGGKHILSAGFDGSIQFRDLASGGLVGDPMSMHAGPVLDLAVTVDGRVVAVGVTGRLTVWDLRAGRLLGESVEAHEGPSVAVAVAPDGTWAVSGGEDGTMRIWDLDSLQQLEVLDAAVDGRCPILAVAVMPGGTHVVVGCADGRLTRVDLTTPDRGRVALHGHSTAVRAVAPADGDRAVSVGDDGTARVWDLGSHSPADGPLLVLAPPSHSAVTPTASASEAPVAWSSPLDLSTGPRDPGVATDDESAIDQLGITDDVHTMAAMLAAVGTTPPLSIALLGNWGAGKSTFMRLVRQRVADLARSARDHPGRTGFVGAIWQVRFNAWHYSDDHLWVGIVEHLFRELRERPGDGPRDRPAAQLRTELEVELAAEKARQLRLESTLKQVDDLDPDRGWLGWLAQPLRTALVLRESGRSAVRQLRSIRVLVGLLLIGAGIAVALVAQRFGATLSGWATGAVTVATGLLTSVIAVWRRVRELTDAARQKLLDERRRGATEIERLESELNRLDPARELDHLLTEITSTDRYERYRGLTGRIHHDLSRLSDTLGAANADPEAQTRIILYVDDLDRCVASRVVEVLQAVNLLLSMPLFNVVVAVDPRWLLRAIDEHHGSLLNARATGQTHSLDYLDKIFHVPYALPPMSSRGEGYLRLVLPNVEYRTPPTPPSPNAPATPVPPLPPPPTKAPVPPPPVSPDQPPSQPVPPPVEVRTDRLCLSMEEWTFLPLLAPLVPTPRAAKKLSNLYRLVRGGVAVNDRDTFIGDGTGPYQAAALLLAAVCSAPGQAEALLQGLLMHEDHREHDIEAVFRSLAEAAPIGAVLADLVRDLRSSGTPVGGDVATFTEWAPRVARYSFATYHLFTADQ